MVIPENNKESSLQRNAAEHPDNMLDVRGAGASPIDDMKDAVDAVGKTAVAAALAGAVASGAAAVTPDQIHLPEPTPIVQTFSQAPDLPDQATDDQAEKKESAWKSIFKILKYALLAIFFAAAFIFGVLQGCASCAGNLAAPLQSSDSNVSSSTNIDISSSAEVEASAA